DIGGAMVRRVVLCRIRSCALVAAVLICAGCSQNAHKPIASHSKLVEYQQKVELKREQINKLKSSLAKLQKQNAKDNQTIPRLLALSDTALKQAQSYAKEASDLKDAKKSKLIKDKAKKAQLAADARAIELVALRQNFNMRLMAMSRLQDKIKALSKENDTASQ